MAITTYAELQTSVSDFLNRDDLTSVIPTFIDLAEAQIQRDIRHWKMEVRSSGQQSSGDRFMQIPADWLETRRFHLTGDGTHVLNLVSADTMADKRQGSDDVAGRPADYMLSDGQFELYPTPDADYDMELLYLAKIPALSDSNTSNWLLSEAPDVYLYGSLVHSAPYLQEDDRLGVWAQLYGAAVERVVELSDKAKWSGSGLKMKNRGLG